MSTRFLKTAALVVLTTLSALALADDTPSRVGRISLTQGQVSISGEAGDETEAALVNWPVTSRNQITTGRGSRTEIRIGSTAVRLDADSALDVAELEDDSLRLHLHYGSASVIVRNPDVLRDFELSTPQGVVRMQETGRMRIDAGRREDTTSVSVFDGVAAVDGGGSRLIVRAGKRVELTRDDVRTGLAMRDGFDEWAMLRDLRDERSESVRYVTSEMTGYEDLDQHGAWSEDSEYGPIWAPRSVPMGWAPYRDGRWTYLHPWGWTWVDNAPWGYAPFHYGRWVMVGSRWCWSPGRNVSRVVWSPALVGWVGGSNWNVGFNHGGSRRAAPAQGWYPLSPRDTYTPTYRMKHENLRFVNRPNGEARDDVRRRGDRHDHNRRQGLTVVPHDQFSGRGTVVVPAAPRAIVSTSLLLNAPTAVAPPLGAVRGRERDSRYGERRADRDGDGRPDNRYERGQGLNVGTSQNVPPAPRPAIIVATPQRQAPAPAAIARQDGNEAPRRELGTFRSMPAPAPALPPGLQTQPANTPSERGDRFTRYERVERNERNERIERNDPERERRARGAESYQQQMQQPQQPQRQSYQVQQAQPQPQRMAPPSMPPPQMQRQPMAPPSMPPPQMQQPQPQPQPQPRLAPPPQPVRQAPPPEGASSSSNQSESQRRAREDVRDRR